MKIINLIPVLLVHCGYLKFVNVIFRNSPKKPVKLPDSRLDARLAPSSVFGLRSSGLIIKGKVATGIIAFVQIWLNMFVFSLGDFQQEFPGAVQLRLDRTEGLVQFYGYLIVGKLVEVS